jgi:hypothetical protein
MPKRGEVRPRRLGCNLDDHRRCGVAARAARLFHFGVAEFGGAQTQRHDQAKQPGHDPATHRERRGHGKTAGGGEQGLSRRVGPSQASELRVFLAIVEVHPTGSIVPPAAKAPARVRWALAPNLPFRIIRAGR